MQSERDDQWRERYRGKLHCNSTDRPNLQHLWNDQSNRWRKWRHGDPEWRWECDDDCEQFWRLYIYRFSEWNLHGHSEPRGLHLHAEQPKCFSKRRQRYWSQFHGCGAGRSDVLYLWKLQPS